MTDLEEAYAIMEGTTMVLPEKRHLLALAKELLELHERNLEQIGRELKELREGIGK